MVPYPIDIHPKFFHGTAGRQLHTCTPPGITSVSPGQCEWNEIYNFRRLRRWVGFGGMDDRKNQILGVRRWRRDQSHALYTRSALYVQSNQRSAGQRLRWCVLADIALAAGPVERSCRNLCPEKGGMSVPEAFAENVLRR